MTKSFLILQIILVVSLISLRVSAYTIIIDPGHGGEDNGAIKGNVIESRITLQVALKLAAKFEQDKDTKIVLTRNRNSSISLKDRTQAAEINDADLFVSIHGNSSTDSRAKGAEFYFGASNRSNASATSKEQKDTKAPTTIENIISSLEHNARLYRSSYLASDTFHTWKKGTATQARAIRQAPFYVINKNTIPSVLVEIGFITNRKESMELIRESAQDQLAESLYQAISSYREKSKLN
ncbi:MAG: hypothetical protein RJB66_1249 [Pseudomonadota bacterium]|jgi:N-acetylmuramoyl-L-alanine amidase